MCLDAHSITLKLLKQYRTIEQMCSDAHSITLKLLKQYRTIEQMCSDAHSLTNIPMFNVHGILSYSKS